MYCTKNSKCLESITQQLTIELEHLKDIDLASKSLVSVQHETRKCKSFNGPGYTSCSNQMFNLTLVDIKIVLTNCEITLSSNVCTLVSLTSKTDLSFKYSLWDITYCASSGAHGHVNSP